MARDTAALSIVIIGASGDLAQRKIYPALFALHCEHLLPENFHVLGFARSDMDTEAFRNKITSRLTCRNFQGPVCQEHIDSFLQRCTYVSGQYDDPESFRRLHDELSHLDPEGNDNRIFYLSIPPFLFLDVAKALAAAGHVQRANSTGWSRVVIEKPFGHDRASSDELTDGMAAVFDETQTYRIDHYLGKEVIQNLLVLRFANLVFDPIWNRNFVHDVRISWTENLSLEGRAGYFDGYGIIRDVMQNHLLQMLALVAMDSPVSYDSQFVRDEKVKALHAVSPVTLDNLVVGQYTEGEGQAAYLDEAGVPADSISPTYAACVLFVRNRRWDRVPFLIRAGKGLKTSMTEIRMRFRDVPGNIFESAAGQLSPNELVIRIQPDATISLNIVNKVPGIRLALDETFLDLSYARAFRSVIPEAYETLLLDVIRGDRSLFIRADELAAAWDIFTPALHALEERNVKPRPYAFGSDGPDAAFALASRFGVTW